MDINRHWYRSSYTLLTFLLLPLSWVFRFIVFVRRQLYRLGLKKIFRFSVPVIVVGNITVGGTGKTPFVIWLAHFLQAQGWQPGIVSRGYGGNNKAGVQEVSQNSNPHVVGDEAVLLFQQAGCPVVVGVDRIAAVKELLEKNKCNIIISDDGLQHYRLGRDIEIALIDGVRRFGNKTLLPAGPLREPLSRLQQVDWVVTQQYALQGEAQMLLEGDTLVSVLDERHKEALNIFENKKVHAVAAIGNPERFFSNLRDNQMDIIEHVFTDHYLYQKEDFNFGDDLPIIMTEKDAVKCKKIADKRFWYLPVLAKLSPEFEKQLLKKLKIFIG